MIKYYYTRCKDMKKINNKGFTLIELLTVMAVLVIIFLIAIPSITSSLSRSDPCLVLRI